MDAWTPAGFLVYIALITCSALANKMAALVRSARRANNIECARRLFLAHVAPQVSHSQHCLEPPIVVAIVLWGVFAAFLAALLYYNVWQQKLMWCVTLVVTCIAITSLICILNDQAAELCEAVLEFAPVDSSNGGGSGDDDDGDDKKEDTDRADVEVGGTASAVVALEETTASGGKKMTASGGEDRDDHAAASGAPNRCSSSAPPPPRPPPPPRGDERETLEALLRRQARALERVERALQRSRVTHVFELEVKRAGQLRILGVALNVTLLKGWVLSAASTVSYLYAYAPSS